MGRSRTAGADMRAHGTRYGRPLEGKTALVTGGSRGIGRGIALRLAADGALVAVHYGSSEAAARETVETIRSSGGQALAIRAELGVVGDAAALYAAFDAGMGEFGVPPEFDILVNNAGVSGSGRITEVTEEVFDRLVAVNVRAPLFLVQHGLKRLRDGGRIINISSAATRRAFPESIGYAMTKGAVDTLTLALARQLGNGDHGQRGGAGFRGDGHERTAAADPEAAAALAAYSVFNRIGRPDDIADVVAFLASDDSRWITGQYVDATGGTIL